MELASFLCHRIGSLACRSRLFDIDELRAIARPLIRRRTIDFSIIKLQRYWTLIKKKRKKGKTRQFKIFNTIRRSFLQKVDHFIFRFLLAISAFPIPEG